MRTTRPKTPRWSTLGLAVLVAGSLTACNPAQRAKVAVEEIHSGNAAACASEVTTMERAVEAYTLLKPDSPLTEAALVTDGFIREESKLMDITATGAIVPSPGSVCA
jgi:hypothetical protein